MFNLHWFRVILVFLRNVWLLVSLEYVARYLQFPLENFFQIISEMFHLQVSDQRKITTQIEHQMSSFLIFVLQLLAIVQQFISSFYSEMSTCKETDNLRTKLVYSFLSCQRLCCFPQLSCLFVSTAIKQEIAYEKVNFTHCIDIIAYHSL